MKEKIVKYAFAPFILALDVLANKGEKIISVLIDSE
jgi:hypothetical protein